MPNFTPRSDGVLIFDIEARPTAWIGGDFVGRTMTAYAFTYLDDDEVVSDAITAGDKDRFKFMAIELAAALETATLCVGHFIRGFDLPVINADLERVRQKSLPRLLTADTKSDRLQGVGLSESLENLSARYELNVQKMDMREPYWEEFNLWQTPESRKKVLKRVETDILGTKELYKALLEAGRLKGPKAWDPSNAKMMRYSR